MAFNFRTPNQTQIKKRPHESDSKNLAFEFDKMNISRKRKFHEISNSDEEDANRETMNTSDISLNSHDLSYRPKRGKITDSDNSDKKIRLNKHSKSNKEELRENQDFYSENENIHYNDSHYYNNIARYDKTMEECYEDQPTQHTDYSHSSSNNNALPKDCDLEQNLNCAYSIEKEQEYVSLLYSRKNKELMAAIGYINNYK